MKKSLSKDKSESGPLDENIRFFDSSIFIVSLSRFRISPALP
jgi:hypothetical protein